MKKDLEAASQKDVNPDILAVTPLLGNRQLKGAKNFYTLHLPEAFERATREMPEETLLFLNEKHLRERARFLKSQFIEKENGGQMAYAVKANSHQRILRLLSEEGIDAFDCASPDEITAVLSVNPEAQILYNHPIKKEKDIRWAVDMGVRHFTAQTITEVRKILRNSRQVKTHSLEIAARLDTPPNPHAGIDLSEKFGASEGKVRQMIREVKSSGAKSGISIHTGSQNSDPEIFCRGIQKMMQVAYEESGVHSINIGGGLPANILKTDRFKLEEFMTVITATIRSSIDGVLKKNQKIFMEPGRAMVAESIDLLIPILSVEERNGEKVLYMDDGVFTSFSDAIIHGWKYEFRTWKKGGEKHSRKKIPFRVFGRTCDSGDNLGYIDLPEDIQTGDYLHIPTAGAYTDSQATKFNGFHPPEYVSYSI